MGVFVFEGGSIDDVLMSFNNLCESRELNKVSDEKRPLYEKFIKAQIGRRFVIDSEFFDMIELFSHIVGDREIAYEVSGESRPIRLTSDLRLLSRKVAKLTSDEGCNLNNNLFALYSRFNSRYGRRKKTGSPARSWPAAIDEILSLDMITEMFGRRVSYKSHVLGSIKYTEDEDLELLKQYVLGQRDIINPETMKAERISNHNQLFLLSNTYVKAKYNGERVNPELYHLYRRISNWKKRYEGLNWEQALNELFKSREVVSYFGQEITYEDHVHLYGVSYRKDIELLRNCLLGNQPIVHHKTKKEQRIKNKNSLIKLLSHLNITATDDQGNSLNPELYGAYNRLTARYERGTNPGWKQHYYRLLFGDRAVQKHLGSNTVWQLGIDFIRQIALAEYDVFPKEGVARRIQMVDDLRLLSEEVATLKNASGAHINYEMWLLKEFAEQQGKGWKRLVDRALDCPKIRKKYGSIRYIPDVYKQNLKVRMVSERERARFREVFTQWDPMESL